MDDLFNVKYTKMLSFSLVAEALTGLIYHRPSGENSKFLPLPKVAKVLEKKNNSFLIIGDTPRDVAILQSETKMKAGLGQNVKISLPKGYQSSPPKKSLVIKFQSKNSKTSWTLTK